MRKLDLTKLRQHFAVVLQDPFLFTGTLAENIRLGNEDITEEVLRQAALDVNVLDFIETLPGKFDEPVQERGNSLSTGQKQLSTLPARWPTIPASSSSTKPRRAWTPTPSCAYAARSSAWLRAAQVS